MSSPAATAPRSSSPTETTVATPLDGARAFAVMLGGPIVLVTSVVAAAVHTLRALRARRRPRLVAITALVKAAAYVRWIVPWMRRWGATNAELHALLPGDGTVLNPAFMQTHAITIEAPASAVWPWIAQIGQDRGGFYSYTWLENLAGCEMHNADHVHPEWQRRQVGDTVRLHPATGLKVVEVKPGRALVLEGGWSLHVEPDGPDRCRLLARFRAPQGAAGHAYGLLLELPHFLMERKMLLEIKRRAEAAT